MAQLRNALARIRRQRGMRQRELAELVGISRQSLGSLEAGRSAPSTTIALQLAKVLRCPFDELFWLGAPAEKLRVILASASADRDWSRAGRGSPSRRWADASSRIRSSTRRVVVDHGRGRAPPRREASDGGTVNIDLSHPRSRFDTRCWSPVARPRWASWPPARSGATGRERLRWLEAPSVTALELLGRAEVHVAGLHLFD